MLGGQLGPWGRILDRTWQEFEHWFLRTESLCPGGLGDTCCPAQPSEPGPGVKQPLCLRATFGASLLLCLGLKRLRCGRTSSQKGGDYGSGLGQGLGVGPLAVRTMLDPEPPWMRGRGTGLCPPEVPDRGSRGRETRARGSGAEALASPL